MYIMGYVSTAHPVLDRGNIRQVEVSNMETFTLVQDTVENLQTLKILQCWTISVSV